MPRGDKSSCTDKQKRRGPMRATVRDDDLLQLLKKPRKFRPISRKRKP